MDRMSKSSSSADIPSPIGSLWERTAKAPPATKQLDLSLTTDVAVTLATRGPPRPAPSEGSFWMRIETHFIVRRSVSLPCLVYQVNFEARIFRRRRASSAASANNQSRNVE